MSQSIDGLTVLGEPARSPLLGLSERRGIITPEHVLEQVA